MSKNVNATGRFFAVRTAIAKRKAANENITTAIPTSEFEIRIALIEGTTSYGFCQDGSYTIDHAKLVLPDGREIDGKSVLVDAKIAGHVDYNLLYESPEVVGNVIISDTGYTLISHKPVSNHFFESM